MLSMSNLCVRLLTSKQNEYFLYNVMWNSFVVVKQLAISFPLSNSIQKYTYYPYNYYIHQKGRFAGFDSEGCYKNVNPCGFVK